MTLKRRWELGSAAISIVVISIFGVATVRQYQLNAALAHELEMIDEITQHTQGGSVAPIDNAVVAYRRGASASTRDSNGDTLIHWAAAANDPALVKELVDHGIDPNCRGQYQKTPLIYAASSQAVSAADYLLSNHADVNARDQFKLTPLHYSTTGLVDDTWTTSECCPEMTALLLHHHAEVDARDQDGMTPLMLAVQEGEVSKVRMLLRAGAKRDLRANDGKSALALADEVLLQTQDRLKETDVGHFRDYAVIHRLKQIIRLLSAAGAWSDHRGGKRG